MRWPLEQFRGWALDQGQVGKYDDGQYRGECVSLINQYCYRVLGVPAKAWGHAKDWATNAAPLVHFDKVSSVQAGDILVYAATSGNLYGHIEIALGNDQAIGQNRLFDYRVRQAKMLGGYIAILRNKVTSQGGEVMIQDTDHEYARWSQLGYQVRGRRLSREEFRKHAVGKTWLQAIEVLSDDKEAHIATRAQEIGQLAIKDNWEGQIYGLIAKLKAMPQNTTDAEKRLQNIRDALGIK